MGIIPGHAGVVRGTEPDKPVHAGRRDREMRPKKCPKCGSVSPDYFPHGAGFCAGFAGTQEG